MPDLFGAPVIPGLVYREGVIGAAEHDELVAQLEATDLEPFRFHGWIGNRKTRTFGWRYDFDDASFAPADPIPEWLLPLRDTAAKLAGVAPDDFAHVLLARYDPGAGIGWHRDRPQFEDVVGFSLGSPAVIRFRQRTGDSFRRANVHLEPRSAYLLSGEVRHDWKHSIVPGATLRFSITFRTLSAKGKRLAEAELKERSGSETVVRRDA
jgi:alkylated DNA repair protein (DNA oxidative demethylase)